MAYPISSQTKEFDLFKHTNDQTDWCTIWLGVHAYCAIMHACGEIATL